jgi:hypothetical protein
MNGLNKVKDLSNSINFDPGGLLELLDFDLPKERIFLPCVPYANKKYFSPHSPLNQKNLVGYRQEGLAYALSRYILML